VCICIYCVLYTHIHTYIYIYIYIYICMYAYMYVCIFICITMCRGRLAFSARCLHWPSAEARMQGEINYLVLRRNGSSADTERKRERERERAKRKKEKECPADTILSHFIADLQLPRVARHESCAFETPSGLSRGNHP